MIKFNFSEHFIEADDDPLKGSTTSMVDMDTYMFKILNTGKLHFTECLHRRII